MGNDQSASAITARFPSGLTSREACAYALGVLSAGGTARDAVMVLSRYQVAAHTLSAEPSGYAAVVVISAGAAAEEYTSIGDTAESALEVALTVAAFPPTLEDAMEQLLARLTESPLASREFEHARACARAALIHARAHS